METVPITPDLVKKHGLTPDEYERIRAILKRDPSVTELGIFSVMWSEHCSYKNTKPLLRTFPTRSDRVLVGAGEENAGILDIGDGLAVAFKIESHNHPSAVEPFQGAATGVGGIIRDIFTMGARPIAALNSLRFGRLQSAEVRRLFRGVVAGIAHYGNCFGIPTVGGEVCFDDSYEGNPLVNAFCLGVLHHEQIARGAAKGIGNPVFYVGPATGRDGLAGAAFASQDLTEESAEQQRGAVQVGDPFMEKLVMEACLELLATDAVVGIQDMGAAGLTCSSCETASRANTGIEIDLDRVPQRAAGMNSYEIMLSESQERMLIIVAKGREAEVKRIFDKWDLPWAEIGLVTDTGRMVVRHQGEVVADIPAKPLADDAPVYHREARVPDYIEKIRAVSLESYPDLSDVAGVLRTLMVWPNLASKNWVYQQYDYTVRDGSVMGPGGDAAIVRVKQDSLPPLKPNSPNQGKSVAEKYLALTVDGNGSHVYLDPYEGGKLVVAEAVRNLACVGATPIGCTDNLNFGNPHHPDLFWQLKEAVRGLSEACSFFQTPVTGGNVSLYNQSPKGPIDPTPTLAMVGIMERPVPGMGSWFREDGDLVYLLGPWMDESDPWKGLGGSAYWRCLRGEKVGTAPRCQFQLERTLQEFLLKHVPRGDIQSAHDCSEGGLAVTLAECCIGNQKARNTPVLMGARIEIPEGYSGRWDAFWFGETPGRVVVSVKPEKSALLEASAHEMGLPCHRLGIVGGDHLHLKYSGNQEVAWELKELHEAWYNALEKWMDRRD